MKYVRKPLVVEAFQWNGHGAEEEPPVLRVKADARVLLGKCKLCNHTVMDHGRIVGIENEMRVCPGDYVITDVEGQLYPCRASVFHATYEESK